jgi:hypothetical protein
VISALKWVNEYRTIAPMMNTAYVFKYGQIRMLAGWSVIQTSANIG